MHRHRQSSLRQVVVLTVFLVGAYGLLELMDAYASIALSNTLQDFFTLSLSVFVEAFPFLVLGSLLASAVNTYVPAHGIEKVLPKTPWLRRLALSFTGFLFPVCECGNVPLSRSMIANGLKPSQAITFLLAAPVINPVTIWSTWAAFSYDGSIVVSRIAATLLIANIVGFVYSRYKREEDFLTKDFVAYCADVKPDKKQRGNRKQQLGRFSSSFVHESIIMVRMLAFGALIAGAVQVFVPRDILTTIGGNVVLSIIAMMLLAFVVSICANVDAFFALSFASTFTAGSIVSFLVFGPMIDIKLLTLLRTTFTTKFLVSMTALVALLSFITGLVVSYAF